MVDAEYYRNLADPALASRRWIILSEAAAAATLSVQYLSSIGAPRPFVLAGSPGTGDLPDPEKAEMAILGSAGGSIMEGFRAYFAAVADLPAEVRERIDEWDPDHTAMALATGLDPDTEWRGHHRRWFPQVWPICKRPPANSTQGPGPCGSATTGRVGTAEASTPALSQTRPRQERRRSS